MNLEDLLITNSPNWQVFLINLYFTNLRSMWKAMLTVVSLKTGALVCLFKSAQGFYMI